MSLPEGYRSPLDHFPNWGDGGPVLVLIDGLEVEARLLIDEAFDGEGEYPVPSLEFSDNRSISFFDVEGWKPNRKA